MHLGYHPDACTVAALSASPIVGIHPLRTKSEAFWILPMFVSFP